MILNEIKIASSNNLFIGIYPSTSRPDYFKDPYFKVFNNTNYNKAEKVARIRILSPRYVEGHSNRDGKSEFKLSRKEINELITCLNKPIRVQNLGNFDSVWEYLRYRLIIAAHDMNINNIDYLDNNIPIPDYRLLK